MQINSIIDIIDGELLNTPSISFIYNIKNNPKRVIEGDLFISSNTEDIKLAINNGAFAIIVEERLPIIDNEIAWIKVDTIQNALIKLFRYKLSNFESKVYYCDPLTMELLELFKNSNKNIKLIENNLERSVKIIEELQPEDTIFCSNKALLNKIYPNNCDFNQNYEINNLIQHSMFETSFSYKELFFSKLKVSSLYINQFLDVFNLFNQELDTNKLKRLNSFKPIFLDKFLSLIEYGKSDKFIVVQPNLDLVENEVLYIKKHYKYAKTIYITKEFIPSLKEKQILLEDLIQLKNILKIQQFNCAYIIGYSFKEIEFILSQSNYNQSLF